VNENLATAAYVGGGDDIRLAVNDEADMAKEALVEDGVDLILTVESPLRQALYLRSCGWWKAWHGFRINGQLTKNLARCPQTQTGAPDTGKPSCRSRVQDNLVVPINQARAGSRATAPQS
jgi:hypothetical protein